MAMNTYALESIVYLTAGLVDRGLADYSLEGACCKIFGTETVWQTINDALQIAGGNGFMEEYPYERALRDSRVNMIFEGTNEILRVLISLSGFKEVGEGLKEVGRALKTPVSSFGVLSDYAVRRVRRTLPAGKPTRVAAELSAEGEALARYALHASGAVEAILRKYGKGVIGKEYHQERLANVAIDLYASLAVISRATSAIAARGAEKSAEEIRLAKLFVRGARHRIVGNLKDMDRNRDPDVTGLSEDVYRSLGYPFPYWN
jgi:acyl-CoA dehydrogenase family protein 9